MGRPIKFKRMVGKDSDSFPALNLVFRGELQPVYFRLRDIGQEMDPPMDQTNLARQVLADFVKLRWKPKKNQPKQTTLKLENQVIKAKKGKGKQGKT